MAKAAPKIVLSPSRDIPFDKLILSQSNVRRVKNGVTIENLADSIARRSLLHGLNVRPQLDDDGAETGFFEVPAGGRRYSALAILVKRKRMAKDALVPCVVKAANDPVLAEEDSLAENSEREPLHPLDEFHGMKVLIDKGEREEAIAAHFRVTPAVVRQRLKLAAVSPTLHEVYVAGDMTLDQLMAFTVSDDHARQEQLWKQLDHSINKSPSFIRDKLTEDMVETWLAPYGQRYHPWRIGWRRFGLKLSDSAVQVSHEKAEGLDVLRHILVCRSERAQFIGFMPLISPTRASSS